MSLSSMRKSVCPGLLICRPDSRRFVLWYKAHCEWFFFSWFVYYGFIENTKQDTQLKHAGDNKVATFRDNEHILTGLSCLTRFLYTSHIFVVLFWPQEKTCTGCHVFQLRQHARIDIKSSSRIVCGNSQTGKDF